MQVTVLASGSKGNSVFVEMEGVKLLVDAGISTRRIKQELSQIGQDIAELDGVFITHEHSDHISGLATLAKKYHIPVFSRPDTFRAMSCYKNLPLDTVNPIVDQVRLGRVAVRAFGIPHDAADPVGYAVLGSSKCVVATDMGFVSSQLRQELEGARVLVLESNHDTDMLKNGSYPWPLKQRILSNRGHLSNTDAAWTIVHLKQRPQKVLLAHLSEKNNTPQLALETVNSILQQQGAGAVEIHMTSQNSSVSVSL